MKMLEVIQEDETKMATNLRQGLGKRGIVTALLVLVIGAGLAACGEATPAAVTEPTATTAAAAGDVVTTQPTEAPASADTGDMQEAKLVLTEWAIEPSTVEVPAGKVRL